MHPFTYHRPSTLDEAVAAFQAAEEPVYLSGGMTLIPTLKQRLSSPTDVIDLCDIDTMSGIEGSGGTLTVGAFTRHAEVAASDTVRQQIPALASLAALIGDNQVRNRGTMGGSVANSDPAADYPAAVVALGADVLTNARTIAAEDYFQDLFETALEHGEIIRGIRFRVPDRAAYAKFAHPASRYAVVGVMIAQFGKEIRVGVTGAGPCAFRAKALEQALNADLSVDALKGVEIPAGGLNSDMHASAEYRAHLVGVMAGRALQGMLNA